MPQQSKQQIAAALSLPGFENWRPTVDVPKLNRPSARPPELPGQGRIAAVMVLMFPGPGNPDADRAPRLVLTKRHSNLSKHAGQISLPGGRQDPGETLEQTALRETFEEIGIAPDQVEILGQLNSVYIPPSDFTVSPFVGWCDDQPTFVRSPAEVDEIIETSLANLLNPSTMVLGDVSVAGNRTLRVPYYRIGSHQVWGATAIILGELIERLSRIRV